MHEPCSNKDAAFRLPPYDKNMCVKQNALNLAQHYPLAAKAVDEAFYVDDGLTGADNVHMAIKLYTEHEGNLTIGKGVLLYDNRIVNLPSLQREVITKIHEGHQGIESQYGGQDCQNRYPIMFKHVKNVQRPFVGSSFNILYMFEHNQISVSTLLIDTFRFLDDLRESS